ncbi:hypothetical protein N9166_01045 [bacterium]|nr:hypothetical protein [bacterium]
MIEFPYELLGQLGFEHPLHPAITHLPMGGAMAAFLFAIASLKNPNLARTAHHCAVLALIFVVPTIIVGIMDWQHFYAGEWSVLFVIKFILAGVLSLSLLIATRVAGTERANSNAPLLLYALCFLVAVGLGFTGGEILYG